MTNQRHKPSIAAVVTPAPTPMIKLLTISCICSSPWDAIHVRDTGDQSKHALSKSTHPHCRGFRSPLVRTRHQTFELGFPICVPSAGLMVPQYRPTGNMPALWGRAFRRACCVLDSYLTKSGNSPVDENDIHVTFADAYSNWEGTGRKSAPRAVQEVDRTHPRWTSKIAA